jgi:predicted amidohydrolase YtcJ
LLVTNAVIAPESRGLSAILIDKGDFAAVVPMEDAGALRTPGLREVDLGHRTVLPGIDDSHVHAYELGRSLTAVDLRGTKSIDELHQRLRSATPDANGWIRGHGWDGTVIHGTAPDGGPCAADIDEVLGGIPALLGDITGHAGLCNSAALLAAGISAQTADPAGGSFPRDVHGVPTGVVLEAAVGVINDAIPDISALERVQALLAAQDFLLTNGIISVTDPGLGPGARTLMDGTGDLSTIDAYRSLETDGRLHMRVQVMLLFGGLGGTTEHDVITGLDAWGAPMRAGRDGLVSVAQLKVFADGIPRSRTAWLREPYDDCTHGHLQLGGSTDEERVANLNGIVAGAVARDWQVGAHAIGDLTISSYLDAIAAAGDSRSSRHYVIHGDLIDIADYARMVEMNIGLNSNPSIRWTVGHRVSALIGDERNRNRQRLRTARDLGVTICSASDAPVASPDWRLIMACAMTRRLSDDPDYRDGETLTPSEAIASMTSAAAWQSHEDTWRGSIRPGMSADLVVLDRCVDWDEPWSLTEANVAATMTRGHVVKGTL